MFLNGKTSGGSRHRADGLPLSGTFSHRDTHHPTTRACRVRPAHRDHRPQHDTGAPTRTRAALLNLARTVGVRHDPRDRDAAITALITLFSNPRI